MRSCLETTDSPRSSPIAIRDCASAGLVRMGAARTGATTHVIGIGNYYQMTDRTFPFTNINDAIGGIIKVRWQVAVRGITHASHIEGQNGRERSGNRPRAAAPADARDPQ